MFTIFSNSTVKRIIQQQFILSYFLAPAQLSKPHPFKSTSPCRYFVMSSLHPGMLELSQANGLWATGQATASRINAALQVSFSACRCLFPFNLNYSKIEIYPTFGINIYSSKN